uniref:Endosomal/vacuolar adapter protein YPT35 n=1 Tax=Mycena chlorophos TaxID=658473 RepID=A0ABQ0LWC5_MYCCL|nr:PX domain protein [Mycena chlorophos]
MTPRRLRTHPTSFFLPAAMSSSSLALPAPPPRSRSTPPALTVTAHPFANSSSRLEVLPSSGIDLEQEVQLYEDILFDESPITPRRSPSYTERPPSLFSNDIWLGDNLGESTTFARGVEISGWTSVGDVRGGAYVVYDCVVKTKEGLAIHVHKRYSDFVKLEHELLRALPPSTRRSLPALPPKSPLARYRSAFLAARMRGLEYWLAAVLLHPDIGGCEAARRANLCHSLAKLSESHHRQSRKCRLKDGEGNAVKPRQPEPVGCQEYLTTFSSAVQDHKSYPITTAVLSSTVDVSRTMVLQNASFRFTNLLCLTLGALLYGIYLVLFVTSVYLFIHNTRVPGRAAGTKASGLRKFLTVLKRPMFMASLVLFILATAVRHLSLGVAMLIGAFSQSFVLSVDKVFEGFIVHAAEAEAYLANIATTNEAVDNVCIALALVIGDAMIIYRLWAVWQNRWVVGVAILSLTGMAASLIASIVKATQGGLISGDSTLNPATVFSLITSVYCTALIWYRLYTVGSAAGRLVSWEDSLVRYAIIFAESAGAYTCWQILYATLHFLNINPQIIPLTTQPSVLGAVNALMHVRVAIGRDRASGLDTRTSASVSSGPQNFRLAAGTGGQSFGTEGTVSVHVDLGSPRHGEEMEGDIPLHDLGMESTTTSAV